MYLVKMFLVLILFFPIFTFSQQTVLPDSSKESYNHTIQFYIINEVIVAYKYHFTENSAVRFTLNASGFFNETESDKNSNSKQTDYRKDIYGTHLYEVKAQYLYNLKMKKMINLFFGGGLLGNYKFSPRSGEYRTYYLNTGDVSEGYSESKNVIWHLGISAVAGLECLIYENINLFAEYEVQLTKGWEKDEYSTSSDLDYTRTYTYHMKGYSMKGLRIGLGINF
ncbi:MAG: hypothetical protein M0Q21_10975 [Ignavibacteriaceae bacterium]|nr:hypothetical protein [Ignavibacteriaceae bacterium]